MYRSIPPPLGLSFRRLSAETPFNAVGSGLALPPSLLRAIAQLPTVTRLFGVACAPHHVILSPPPSLSAGTHIDRVVIENDRATHHT